MNTNDEQLQTYIKDFRKLSRPLSASDESELLRQIATQPDSSARVTLAQAYRSLAVDCAEEYYKNRNKQDISLTVLVVTAYDALYWATGKYATRSDKSLSFQDFAVPCIRLGLDLVVGQQDPENPEG